VDESGVSIILVTHDMGVVSEITDRVVVMRRGRVLEQDATSSVLDAPQRNYTRTLLAAVPRLRLTGAENPTERRRSDAFCGGLAESDATILVARDITKTFSGSRLPLFGRSIRKSALRDVSVSLGLGTITGIVGESGSGKSTIGRIIAGLETASAGSLLFDGSPYDISHDGRRSGLLGQVQMIFQDPAVSLNPRMAIGETLAEGLRFGKRRSADNRLDVGSMIDRLGLARILLSRYPHQLSGGQKQRVCIARALLTNPRVIVADEPTSALDVSVQAEIVKLLKEAVNEQGISMLFISHELALVQELCSSLYIFKDGRVEDVGSSEFIFGHSQNPYTRSLIDARPRRFTH
jgi:peptide/nickel transport system ATP-binding protein